MLDELRGLVPLGRHLPFVSPSNPAMPQPDGAGNKQGAPRYQEGNVREIHGDYGGEAAGGVGLQPY
jgi:hypothetical protein